MSTEKIHGIIINVYQVWIIVHGEYLDFVRYDVLIGYLLDLVDLYVVEEFSHFNLVIADHLLSDYLLLVIIKLLELSHQVLSTDHFSVLLDDVGFNIFFVV